MTRDEIVAMRTAGWTADDRAALAALVAALRPSAHHLTDALDWLEDVAAREGVRPGAVLDAPSLRAALAAPGSAPGRWKRWKEALRRLRHPRLAAREQAFRDAVRALDLGRDVAVTPPVGFEGGVVTVTLRARTAAELAAHGGRLVAAHDSGELQRLFTLLD